jgi:hypothetical protein
VVVEINVCRCNFYRCVECAATEFQFGGCRTLARLRLGSIMFASGGVSHPASGCGFGLVLFHSAMKT